MRLVKSIAVIIVLAVLVPSFALAEVVILKPINTPPILIPIKVWYLNTGPRLNGRKSLRVSIVVEEIYPNIFVEEIGYGNTEGDPDLVTASYYLNGFDIANKLGYKWLKGLKFIRWVQWDEFEMKDDESRFKIKYTSDHQFEMHKLDRD